MLLRGLGREKNHWGDFPELLKKKLGVDKVECIDLPGVNDNTESPLSISKIMTITRQKWLETSKTQERWDVIAISLGGMVVLEWLKVFRNDFHHAYIINTSSKLSPITQRLHPMAIYSFIKSAYNYNHYEKREKNILKLTTELIDIDTIMPKWIEVAKESSVSKSLVVRQLIAASQFTPPKSLETPTFFFASEKDRLASYKCSVELAKRYNSKIFITKIQLSQLIIFPNKKAKSYDLAFCLF